MTDPRPRPQYGEYAPEGWVSPHLPVVDVPPPADAVIVVPPQRRTWDTALTLALLALGLYSVLSGFVTFSQLPKVFDQLFTQLGIGTFTSDAAAGRIEVIANVTQTALWLAAVLGAAIRLRRNKIAFWWPLAAGVLATIALIVLVSFVLASDPAYVAYLATMRA